MRIAILGTRGIPARYGGFETFAEELSVRLVERGHEVTVFCRRGFFQAVLPSRYRGVRLHAVPTVMHKYLETPLHGLLSLCTLIWRRYDAVLLCNGANSPFAWIARLLRIPIAINVDGIERQRAKWSALGKLWYRLGERCSVWFASRVVADADVIAEYYRDTYGCATEIIAYAATAHRQAAGSTLAAFALRPNGYVLYVSRLEPENNALGVIEAYRQVTTELPLVIVGDAPYAQDYIAKLRASADSRVIFTGYQFGEAYQELQSNCYCYIQATEVGGTHPALIEAMAYGNCVIANGTPENREVLSDCGLIYRKNDFAQLAELLRQVLNDAEAAARYGVLAKARAAERYSWEAICDSYERLFFSLVARSSEATGTAAGESVQEHKKSV